jgi:probable rRNA maturation factor
MNVAGLGTVAGCDAAQDGEPQQPLRIALVREDGDWSAFQDLEAAIDRAAGALARHPDCRQPAASQASVVLGSDALLARLNRAFRGKQGATNVLSFPYQRPAGQRPAGQRPASQRPTGQRPAGLGEEGYLGDVVLAAQTVHREAVERGIEPTAHLQHLVVHGLLHLLGRGHETDAEAEAMEALESAILAAVGVADPHGRLPA